MTKYSITPTSRTSQVGAILEVAGGALAAAAERLERDQLDLRAARDAAGLYKLNPV
jgi:hypothetical protein